METVQSYRALLRDTLIERKRKNAQYSLRSFAKTLGIQPSFLSLILNGKRDLSDTMAAQIAERLLLNEKETQAFELLVRIEKTDSPTNKKRLLEQLQKIAPKFQHQKDLGVEQFRLISEWYHFAILTLIEIKDFKWSVSAIAKTLSIHALEVEQAIERLHALELIESLPGKRPTKTNARFIIGSQQHEEAIKKYHLQMLGKVIVAQTEHSPQERFTGTEDIALSPDQIPEANQILEECLQKMLALSLKKSKKAEVYHVGAHLIRLSKNQS